MLKIEKYNYKTKIKELMKNFTFFEGQQPSQKISSTSTYVDINGLCKEIDQSSDVMPASNLPFSFAML